MISDMSGWLRGHSGSVVSPKIVMDRLSRNYDFLDALRAYSWLEDRGSVVPVSYQCGVVTSVRIFPLKTFRPMKINSITDDQETEPSWVSFLDTLVS